MEIATVANNTENYIPLNGAVTLRFTPITLNGSSFNPATQGGTFQLNIGKTLENTLVKKSSANGAAASGDFTITSTGVAVYLEPEIIAASGGGTDGIYYVALYVYPTGATDPITHLEQVIKVKDQLPLD